MMLRTGLRQGPTQNNTLQLCFRWSADHFPLIVSISHQWSLNRTGKLKEMCGVSVADDKEAHLRGDKIRIIT